MKNSFFPRVDTTLVVWLTNYQEKITSHATALGLTPTEVAEQIAYCQGIIDTINAANNQKNLYNSALQARNEAIDIEGGRLRLAISRNKTATGYTEAIGQDLGIISTATEFNPATYKSGIFAELFGGNVRIRFKKLGADGINLYCRPKGTANFTFLSRATRSPFEYRPVLAEQNKPEHWEYRAFGVIDDVEIGIASDIVEIIFGE